MQFKKFRPSEDAGSAVVEFALLVGPTIAVASCLVLMSQYLVRSSELRLATFEIARASSAIGPRFSTNVDDVLEQMRAEAGLELAVTRFAISGINFVRVDATAASPLSLGSSLLADSQTFVDQSALQ